MLLTETGTRRVILPLKNRRADYSWPPTRLSPVQIEADKRIYSVSDSVHAKVSFKLVGGLREAFHPDVWTLAWEDFDKILRLTLRTSVRSRGGVLPRKVAEGKKEVRRASFYWSRDPDLPYRIWVMVVPEDGGPPKIPSNVEDAKSKMLDVDKEFSIPASSLGVGKHKLIAEVSGKWGRRSFIEKGMVNSKSQPLVIQVE